MDHAHPVVVESALSAPREQVKEQAETAALCVHLGLRLRAQSYRDL
jgi:hypothetical protein